MRSSPKDYYFRYNKFLLSVKYKFSFRHPSNHLLDIELKIDKITASQLLLQLPSWRPGRYELGNFAKNIKQFRALNENGTELKFAKLTKDLWQVQTNGASSVHIHYQYFSAELNAGSTYLDPSQLYVNPVNCCMYVPERITEPCEIELVLPDNYLLASSLAPVSPAKEPTSRRKLLARDFHELADSPFIASPTIQHLDFVVGAVKFHLWFQGECKPNWKKLESDFTAFIKEQFRTMNGPIPSLEYHFLFQILPFRFHHGVEHLDSTVIALGPSYEIMAGDTYTDLLGVSSHELFHSWNIKAIRPAEMQPYDYTRENYSRLGYVCEGVTTYYGDLLLFRSGLYTDTELFKEFNRHIQVHMDNAGRFNLSVADSSFDTWLDGYAEITPHRKTSIYSEGCLIAWMTDILIRQYTENKHSLDDVMQILFNEFYKAGKGYTEADYFNTCSRVAGHSLENFFSQYAYQAISYENALLESIDLIGIQLVIESNKKYHERHYGFRILDAGGVSKVISVYPYSPADKAGLEPGDELVSINGFPVKNNLSEWCRYFNDSQPEIQCISRGRMKSVKLTSGTEEFYKTYSFRKNGSATSDQKKAFKFWSGRDF